jgi:hypothetical protein
MYSNVSYLQGEDGSYRPWIEIYNPTNNPIQLDAYFMSSNPESPMQWRFPEFWLAPNDFLLIFVGGEYSAVPPFHAQLSLVNGESPLLLSNSQGQVIQKLDAHCVRNNFSWGSPQDGFGWPVAYHTPSPGQTNLNGIWEMTPEFLAKLSFSHDGGFYGYAIELALTSDLPNSQIHYTLNNSEAPTQNALCYEGAITLYNRNEAPDLYTDILTTNGSGDFYIPDDKVGKSNVLRAQVYYEGCPASPVYTRSFFINNNPGNRHGVNVAAVTATPSDLFGDERGIYVAGNQYNYTQRGDEWERNAHLEIYDANGSSIIDQRTAIRIHGGGTREAPQKSLRLYAKTGLGAGEFNYPFFEDKPLSSYKRLLLRTTMGDWGQNVFKDELTHHVVRNLNIDYMASAPAVVYLNGEYWGIQSLRERQDKYYLQSNYSLSGVEFDIVKYEVDEGAVSEEGDLVAYNQFLNFLRTTDLTIPSNFLLVEEFIDVENAIDFMAAQLYLANMDFPNRNYAMWKARNDSGKWRWMFFDCDACMIRSNYNHLSEYLSDNESVHRFPLWSSEIFRTFMRNDDFRTKFSARLRQLLQSEFSTTNVSEAIEKFTNTYQPLVVEHIQRWNEPANYNIWLQNISELKYFALVRPIEMEKMLEHYFDQPFLVYPNPAAGDFTIDFYGNAYKQIQLYGMNGQLLLDYNFSTPGSDLFQVQSNLPAGIYMLRVLTGGRYYSKKLVISE